MSVLTVRGRRFAAGLYWLDRGGAASVARNARAFKRPWHVHWNGQTGYAADEESPKDCPSLAASLQAHIEAPTWMAMVESDDGRLALVKARDGAFLADGDEVFSERASALDAFQRSRGVSGRSPGPGSSHVPGSSPGPGRSPEPGSSPVGWALHATPGLADGGVGEVTEIDPASLADDPAMRLAPAPFSTPSLPNVGRFLALAAVVAGAAFVWIEREALWTLIAGPEEVAEAEQVPVDPPVMAVLDTGALIAGCRQALMAYPPFMPAWRTERVSCEGRFGDLALIGVRPELEDRAVLTVRWRLGSGRPEPLHRRIAETHLSEWYAASVTGDRAWAAMPLTPVLRRSDAEGDHSAAAPSLLAFREAVDRHFGARAARIEYPAHADGIEMRIATGRVPFGLADAIAAVPGLELVRLTRDSAGEWLLEGRRVSPVSMPRERFEQLTRSAARPLTGSAAQPAGAANGEVTGSIEGAPAGTTGAALNRTDSNGGSGS